MFRVKMFVAAFAIAAGFAFAGAKDAEAQVIVSRYGAFGRRVQVSVVQPYGIYPTYPTVVAPYPYPYGYRVIATPYPTTRWVALPY